MLEEPHCHAGKEASAPIELALGLLAGKWKGIILFHLLDGTARFSELRRRLPAVTQRTLTNQLRDLERDGLVVRKLYAQVPARVEYSISPSGQTLEPILRALQKWGQHYEKRICDPRTMGPQRDGPLLSSPPDFL
ncbi:helix-turn-helix domain-containing protein [Rhizobium sp. NFACC06-2]|uniref:winged helix-turn-helix transcriptional regulator n=1 Tax=Rhizobium sp. NFACC06-2 TaxID=1566264 RepID=UPI0008769883|nr:helix-turn-helix domain-containing protein [Rhizobium sp. NFACC06-2]SCY90446.1 transcriptional regulator, HxlR family [Rhizobium sp. NFACC06-2]